MALVRTPLYVQFSAGKVPDIIERLRGTPARVEELVRGLSANVRTRRDGEAWSIQENVGHLPDIEPLWLGRIDDMLKGDEVMREADLSNRKTHEADHNSRALSELFSVFREVRGQLIDRVEGLTIEQAAKSSIHPRTKLRMRIIDLCLFTADHDDYHLSRISELRRMFAD
jgi:uncharacterized damage-inducible protein DinB